MKMRNTRTPSAIVAAALMISSVLAVGNGWADEAANTPEGFGSMNAVEMEQLNDQRGGFHDTFNTVTSIQNLTGTVNGASITTGQMTNGDITVSNMGNFSGVGLIVNNTGNQSLINAAVGVAINITN